MNDQIVGIPITCLLFELLALLQLSIKLISKLFTEKLKFIYGY